MDVVISGKIKEIIEFLSGFTDGQSFRYRRFFEVLLASGDDSVNVVNLASFKGKELDAIRACYDSLERYAVMHLGFGEVIEKECF